MINNLITNINKSNLLVKFLTEIFLDVFKKI